MKIVSYCTILLGTIHYVYTCSVYEYGVTEKDKQTIVDKHNELRLLIANGKVPGQPRGINLKRMVWDDYLAGQAQNIANTCDYNHKKVSDSRWSVGQNLYRQPTNKIEKGADWNAAVQYWFDEHTKYHYTTKYVFDKNTGHYTQIFLKVVWANTTNVGCGYTYYPIENRYDKLYVCNYGPSGNVDGATIYIVGNSGCNNLC